MSKRKPFQRRIDWPERLNVAIREARETPFQWGTHDCCLFACTVVKAMTDVDPARQFRGRYKTMRGAYGTLKRFAGGGIAETAEKIARRLKRPEVKPAFAQRGDVVLVDTPIGDVLGICVGPQALVLDVDVGLHAVPMTAVKKAWRV